jgi:hypothetical protein
MHQHDSDSDSSEGEDLDGRKPLKHIKKMMKLIERGNVPSRKEFEEGRAGFRGRGGYRGQMRDEGLFRRQPDGLFNAEMNPEPSE